MPQTESSGSSRKTLIHTLVMLLAKVSSDQLIYKRFFTVQKAKMMQIRKNESKIELNTADEKEFDGLTHKGLMTRSMCGSPSFFNRFGEELRTRKFHY